MLTRLSVAVIVLAGLVWAVPLAQQGVTPTSGFGGDLAATLTFTTDNTYDIGATGATRPRSLFLADAAVTAGSGTGVTVDNSGEVRRLAYKVSVAETHWDAAAQTQDLTIATLPAKTRITEVIADLTEAFACSATCTSSTLSMVVGKGSGGSEYLDSFDADAATAVFGDADSERGAALDGVVNGEIPSWSSTQAVVARLTSGTGDLGDGAGTTNLSSGLVTFYIVSEVLP